MNGWWMMDIREFNALLEVDCLTHLISPEVGTKFLTGKRMIAQKDLKVTGQEISWYEVTNVGDDGNISYTVRYGRLENNMREEQ